VGGKSRVSRARLVRPGRVGQPTLETGRPEPYRVGDADLGENDGEVEPPYPELGDEGDRVGTSG